MPTMIFKSFLVLLVSSFLSLPMFAQTGAIAGEILDAATKDGVVGANVVIEGTTIGSPTDAFGKFVIKNVEPGTYTLVVSNILYATRKVTDVVVKEGAAANITVEMTEEVSELESVVVTAARQTNTDLALVQSMKGSFQLLSGISSQMITKSQDRDAAQVVRRVPGVTITDNRFINVRGLSSRYNTVMLNGLFAPSTELESRAFSFDVIPSSMLDQMLVYKSGGAENPGEFGGAVVKVFTKNFVDENFMALSVSGGVRSNTTFQTFNKAEGGSLDFLGFDDGARALPNGFPANLKAIEFKRAELVDQSRRFNNTWGVRSHTALPDLSIRLDVGRRFNLGLVKVSSLNSVSYGSSNQFNRYSRYRYGDYTAERTSIQRFAYTDERFASNARLGAISNWSFTFSPAFKLDFRNFYSHAGLSETTEREGVNYFINREERSQSYRFAMRSILSSQLQGTHTFGEDRSSLTWLAGMNYSSRNEPDWKRSRSFRAVGSEQDYNIVLTSTPTIQNASRFFMNFDELAATQGVDYEYNFSDDGTGAQLKAGYLLEYKQREFLARTLGYRILNEDQFDRSILSQPLDQIFSPENMRSPDGLALGENTKLTDQYKATNLYTAGYLSGVVPLSAKLKLITGLRLEYNRQQLKTGLDDPNLEVDNPVSSLLPSANLTYNFTDKMLVRAAYYRTVNRPEFREIAPFSFYDFDFDADISGNVQLQSATINNFDLRWELYPSASDVVNVGVFYKDFTNAIEAVNAQGTSNPLFFYMNANSAYTAGIEVELRKSLASFTSLPVLRNMAVLVNAALIRSEIDTESQLVNAYKRPLQGQSPYILNAGLYYEDETRGLQISGMYNVIGERIFLVGNNETPPIWEMPRHVIDLTVSKRFNDKLSMKAGITDLLNAPFRLREDGNLDNKISSDVVDKTILSTKNGSYFTLGLGYTF